MPALNPQAKVPTSVGGATPELCVPISEQGAPALSRAILLLLEHCRLLGDRHPSPVSVVPHAQTTRVALYIEDKSLFEAGVICASLVRLHLSNSSKQAQMLGTTSRDIAAQVCDPVHFMPTYAGA